MTKRRLWRLWALVFAFSLVAAACGDSDDDSTSTEDDTSTEADAADDAADDDEGSTGGLTQDALDDEDDASATTEAMDDDTAVFDMTTVEGIFEAAAANRADIVAELTASIDAGDYGIGDDDVLRGPAGFEIDMSACPDDWDDLGGITDTEVRVGHTTAQSGNLAAFGNIALGWDVYFDWVNENGGNYIFYAIA